MKANLCKIINGDCLGGTGKAATLEGFKSVLIEQYATYCEIAQARVDFVTQDEPE